MTAAQMDQFIANLKTDGALTSLPLCYEDPDLEPKVEEILSGHHRVEASIGAGLPEIDYLCIVSKLSEERKRAIQLSHNALVGQDDIPTLVNMYAGLDLSAKTYSGLDDSVLNSIKDVKLAGLSVGVAYQEMRFFFLPEDAEVVERGLAEIEKAAKKRQAHVAAYRDFDDFFELALKAKTKFEVFNNAMAVRLLVDLAMQRLAQIEAEEAAAAQPSDQLSIGARS